MKPSHLQELLGEVVRTRRAALGLSQDEFAALVGLHRTYIGSFERGERNLTLANLSLVADGLGIPLSALIADAEALSSNPTFSAGEPSPAYTFKSLPENRRALLEEMANALVAEVVADISGDSDICVSAFAQDFQDRLVLYHAMNEEVLKKKTFEYAFVHSMRAAGREAILTENPVHAGTDAIVDGTEYSLKTEAAASIARDRITISKLMEARWIRECTSGKDFADGVQRRVVPHLHQYERILMLRAFKIGEPVEAFEYSLVEIPVDLLLKVDGVSAASFTARTMNGSSRSDVKENGRTLFSLRLDGSVEKVTVSGLLVSECIQHGVWRIPVTA